MQSAGSIFVSSIYMNMEVSSFWKCKNNYLCGGENIFKSFQMGEVGEMAEVFQAQAHVWNHTCKFINSMALKCAVQLGIPDIIHSHGQSMSLSELVAALQVPPSKGESLGRLMRLLIHSGFFHQTHGSSGEIEEEVKYSLTPASRLLVSNNATLQTAPFLFLTLDKSSVVPWESLSSWFCSPDERTTVFEMGNGKPTWEYVSQQPDLSNVFYQTMVCDSQMMGRVVTRECGGVFKGLKSLVDVGGGIGIMAKIIAEAFPHITCTVFDLPQVIANANRQQTTKNLSFIGGDMFESKFPPADAVLLKWVLHNWSDERSIKLLKNCKDAIPSSAEGGKVIIIDMVVENKSEDKESIETQLCFDLLMMVNLAGKERTEREWKKLFLAAGFSDYKIISVLGLRSVIEVYP